jgi:tRNA pseudouridine55 synthase
LNQKQSIDRLFVVYKPAGIGSNRYLSKIKRKYGVKKAGFSGTLDPFAKGVLIVAFGKYPKLFRFLKKTPKTYRATLWLGASSPTFDNEKIDYVSQIPKINENLIIDTLNSLLGELVYLPPKYCAKKIDGKRAYTLARNNQEVNLKNITSTIYDIKLLHYMHPFITFETTVSEGTYIRSIGQIISEKLNTFGTLSALERLREGEFIFENEKKLNPLEFLDLKENFYLNDPNEMILGKKLHIDSLKYTKEGNYFVNLGKIISIIKIQDFKVSYIYNGVKIC